jgi:protein-tyrosine kinase
MSRIFEALQQTNPQMFSPHAVQEMPFPGSTPLASASGQEASLEDVASFNIPASLDGRLVVFTEPHSLASIKVRAMAARLRHTQQLRGIKKVLVTSAAGGDGKTTASANLAIALAAQGDKTLLIDGDLHRSALHKLFQVDNQRGFSDWSKDEPVGNILRHAVELPLWFLPAGSGQHPLIKVQASTTPELLKQMSSLFSWIIIDSPPLVPLADASIWNTLVDGVLLLVRQASTPKKVLVKSLESFDKSKLLGVIMNDAVSSEEKYYRNYYVGAAAATNPPTASSTRY